MMGKKQIILKELRILKENKKGKKRLKAGGIGWRLKIEKENNYRYMNMYVRRGW